MQRSRTDGDFTHAQSPTAASTSSHTHTPAGIAHILGLGGIQKQWKQRKISQLLLKKFQMSI